MRPGLSDVDLLSVGLADPPGLGRIWSARYAQLCRGVEISAAAAFPAFPADARAARGFNGDIAWHHRRWRQALESGTAAGDLLGIRAARKTLLTVAGLVSVRDRTWTTDRARAARRWGEIEPDLAAPLGVLLSWATAERRPAPEEVQLALAGDGVVTAVVNRFASLIGLWPCDPQIR